MSPNQATRAAALKAAMGLRKTAHKHLAQAAEFPRHANYCRAEFQRVMSAARWHLRQARLADINFIENTRIAA